MTSLFSMKIAYSLLLSFTLASLSALAKEKGPQAVVISGNDTMQFDVKSFEVKAGSKVKLTLKNVGKIPKIAMGHNLVILKKGVTAVAFGQKALGAGANATTPLPKSLMGDVIATTKLLGPDESETIEFTAPKEPGPYEYVCTFPGHFALMRGIMTVK